jgi:hypothetical protein
MPDRSCDLAWPPVYAKWPIAWQAVVTPQQVGSRQVEAPLAGKPVFPHAELTSRWVHMRRWWSQARHHSTGPHVPCCSEGCWQHLPAAASCHSILQQQAPCIACCCSLCRQQGEHHASALSRQHAYT